MLRRVPHPSRHTHFRGLHAPWRSTMSDPLASRMSAEITDKWHDLAEKRRMHFIELFESGRWKLYYSDAEFASLMREAVQLADDWKRLTVHPGAPDEIPGLPDRSSRPRDRARVELGATVARGSPYLAAPAPNPCRGTIRG
jgi:hypothetical protein